MDFEVIFHRRDKELARYRFFNQHARPVSIEKCGFECGPRR